MREILYRGIPKSDSDRHFFADIWKDNCEGSFVYGSLIIAKDRYYICVSALCAINSCINNGMTSMIEVIPETVGQYTGLTDKNGKKIFEGDLLLSNGSLVWLVSFENGAFVCKDESLKTYFNFYEHSDYDTKTGTFNSYISKHYEVIGSIHDNPELLKGGEG